MDALVQFARATGYKVGCETPKRKIAPEPFTPAVKRRITPSGAVNVMADPVKKPVPVKAAPVKATDPSKLSKAQIEKRLEQLQKRALIVHKKQEVLDRIVELKEAHSKQVKSGYDKAAQRTQLELFELGSRVKIGENPRLEMVQIQHEAEALANQLDSTDDVPKRKKYTWTPSQLQRLEAFLRALVKGQTKEPGEGIMLKISKRKDYGHPRANELMRVAFMKSPKGVFFQRLPTSGRLTRANSALVLFSTTRLDDPFRLHRIKLTAHYCTRVADRCIKAKPVYSVHRGGVLDPLTKQKAQGKKPNIARSVAQAKKM